MMTAEKRERTETQFESLVERLLHDEANDLTPLAAGLIAASHSGYCSDSHTFSKRLGIEHALVIRECVQLAHEGGAITIDQTHTRTQRVTYSLTNAGLSMIEAAN
ncbi:MAG: hypothetical protein AAF739_14840 [Pseudomonadota bacterium]